MSQGTTIDYDALAQQHGGTAAVDYDTLAAQHGGTAQTGQAQERPGFIRRGLQALGIPTSTEEMEGFLKSKPADLATGGLNSLGKALGGYVKEFPQNAAAIPALLEIGAKHQETQRKFQKGQLNLEQAVKEMSQNEAGANYGAIPVVGGNMNIASQDFAAGNYKGAAGTLAGTALPFVAGELAPEGALARANAVAGKVGDTASALAKPAMKAARAGLEDVPIVRKMLPVAKEFHDIPGQLQTIWNPAAPPPVPTAPRTPASTLDPRSLQRPPGAAIANTGPAATSTVIPPAQVAPSSERVPATAPPQPPGQYVPSGEMALNRVLTSLDNKTLLKIARSRGIDVSAEAQLRPGVANNRVIQKISDHFSPEELDALGQQAQEVFAQKPVSGDLTPQQGKDLWTYKALKTFFPDVSMPLALEARARFAMAKRPQSSVPPILASAQTAQPSTPIAPEIVNNASNLEELLRRSLRRR